MNEKQELSRMNATELTAYRNICLMSMRMVGDRTQYERHLPIIESLMKDRGIRFKAGKLLKRA